MLSVFVILFVAIALALIINHLLNFFGKLIHKKHEIKAIAENLHGPFEIVSRQPISTPDDEENLIELAKRSFTSATGGSSLERAEEAISAILKQNRGLNIEDDEFLNILEEFGSLGISLEDQAALAHTNTSLGFIDILDHFGIEDRELIGALLKRLELEVDGDLYKSWRDEDDFEVLAVTLKAGGMSVTEILELEDDYCSIGSEDLEDIDIRAQALRNAGFSVNDIAFALEKTCESLSEEELVVGMMNCSLFNIECIVKMLVLSNVELEDLDEKLREADLAIEDRVELLYKLMKGRNKPESAGVQAEEKKSEQV